jgi:hypothetical protein
MKIVEYTFNKRTQPVSKLLRLEDGQMNFPSKPSLQTSNALLLIGPERSSNPIRILPIVKLDIFFEETTVGDLMTAYSIKTRLPEPKMLRFNNKNGEKYSGMWISI